MEPDEADLEAEELSGTTVAVLCAFGAFFALAALTVLYRLFKAFFRRSPPQNGSAGEPERTASQAKRKQPISPLPELHKWGPVLAVDRRLVGAAFLDSNSSGYCREPAPSSKPGVSLKSLVKQSRKAAASQPAQDVAFEHPLYLNALKGFQDAVSGLAFSPDGLHIATVCEDRVLRVYKLEDAQSKSFGVKRKSLTRDPVDVAFGSATDVFVLVHDGPESAALQKFAFSPSATGEALALDWEKKAVHGGQAGRGLTGGLTDRGIGLVLSYSDATDLQVYDAAGSHLAGINSGGLQNHGAAMSCNGHFLGAATFTTDVRLHEVQYGRTGNFKGVHKVMDLSKAHNGQVYALAFSAKGNRAVTASKDGTWATWNLDVRYHMAEDPKVILKRKQETGEERYRRLAVAPNGLIAAAFGKTLHFLDGFQTGNVLEVIETAHDGPITALEWCPAEVKAGARTTAVLATSSSDRRVRLWRAPLL